MGHLAKVEDGIVTQVIVCDDKSWAEKNLGGNWVQTSYNTAGGIHYDPITKSPSQDQSKSLRKNFAGIGYSYNQELDAFIPPKPYPSWILNEQTGTWYAPVERPNNDYFYVWNEDEQQWEKSEQ